MLHVGSGRRCMVPGNANGAALNLNFLLGALPSRVTFSRASAATYFDGTGLLQTAASGAARFTYNPATLAALGLLIEEARTNLILQSNTFSTTWTTTATDAGVASAAGTSLDGTNNAWTLKELTTTSNVHQLLQSVTKAASALAYTFSIYAKASARTRFAVQLDDAVGNGAVVTFDISGTQIGVAAAGVGVAFTSISATITAVNNSWVRCTLTATSNTATTIRVVATLDNASGTAASSTTYTGTVASGILIYGAQLEQAPFANSYIATTTASVTRAADVATITLTSTRIPASPTGLTIMGRAMGGGISAASSLIRIDDGSSNNQIQLNRAASRVLQAISTVGGSNTLVGTGGGAISDNTTFRFWLAVATNDLAVNWIGGTKATASSGAIPTGLTTLRLGISAAAANLWNGSIARVQIYTRRLPDAQAAAIATAL